MEKSQESGLTKGPWSVEEDQKLIDYIKKNGQGNWQKIAKKAGLNRCGKSCRLRWTNYLKPGIKRGGFSDEEDAIIIALHKEMGNKWSRIAAHLPRRTDNEIKNYWNTHLRKKLLRMGIDPTTHMPIPPPHHDLNYLLSLSHQVDQLLTASNLYNYFNVPSLDGVLLGFPEINADDLIKLQILQNMFQLMNRPLPYNIQGNANLEDHLIQLNRLYHGTPNDIPTDDPFQTHTSLIMSDLSAVSASFLNQIQQPSTSISFPFLEVESNTPGSIMNDRNSMFNPEYSFESLPSLVTVTPESSTVTKLENTEPSYINTDQLDHDQPQTNQFEAWEILNVDDEANSSLWKDIFG